jgi:aspartate/glutamate racemase
MSRIGIIHTTPVTVESISELVKKEIPDAEVINILDDSILKDMNTGLNVDYVRERWIGYAINLARLGVDAVLSACSTVGSFAEEADQLLSIPVLRIDDAMCEEAVQRGLSVTVFATLRSTLEPTADLIRRKAIMAGRSVNIQPTLVDGAYKALMNGDRAEHNRRILEAVTASIDSTDVVVLAQASMASAVVEGNLSEEQKTKILTSPVLGVKKLAAIVKNVK